MHLDQLLEDFSPSASALTRIMLEVFRLNGLLLARGDELTRDVGLTSARWQVLGAVRIAGQPQTVAQIARNMGLTRQGVQRNVDRLYNDGLLELRPNPQHKRAKLVALSPAGQDAAERMRVIHRQWAERLGATVELSEMNQALALLQRLGERLEDE